MQKDVEHFKGSEELLNLVKANVTEASLINETKEQVVKNKMVNTTMVMFPRSALIQYVTKSKYMSFIYLCQG